MKAILPILSMGFLMVLLLLQSPCAQQWEPTKGPEGGTVRALLFDGNDLWAGVWGGVYRFSAIDGAWRPAVNGMATDWEILCLARINQTILAGSESDGIFFTSDTGRNWKTVNAGLTRRAINSLAADDSFFYAIASDGTVYYLPNAGQTWVKIPTNFTAMSGLSSIAVIGQNLLVTATYDTAEGIYRSTRINGTWQSWQKTQAGILNNKLMADGAYVYAGGDNGIYRSSDSGKTWAHMNTGITSYTGVKCFAASNGFLYAGDESGKIFRSGNAGQSWTQVGAKLPSRFWPFGFAASTTNLYVGSQDDGVLVSTDQGMNWTAMNTGLCQRRIFDMEARGAYLFANSELGRLFISDNNGMNWHSVDPSLLGNSLVRCLTIKGQSLFAGTWGAGVFRSDDNGATWISVNQYLTEPYIVSLSVCDTVIYAGTTSYCFQSRDNGARWIASVSGLKVNDYIRGVVKIGGLLLAAGSDSVYRSRDNGANWITASTGVATNAIWTIAALGKDVFVGTWSGVFRTRDTGQTWAPAGFGVPYKEVYDIKSINGLLLAGTNQGSVFISRDTGSFWDPLGSAIPPKYNVIASLAVSDSFIYAGTEQRSVWRYLFANAGIKNYTFKGSEKQGLLSVSFSGRGAPVMTINYFLPREGYVNIKIVDIAGRVQHEVLNKHDSVGQHVATVNIRDLSSGCYFLSIHTDGMAESRRILLH